MHVILLLQLLLKEIHETTTKGQVSHQNRHRKLKATVFCVRCNRTGTHWHKMHCHRTNSIYCKSENYHAMEFSWFIRQKGSQSFIPEETKFPDSELQSQVFMSQGDRKAHILEQGSSISQEEPRNEDSSCWAPDLESLSFRQQLPRPLVKGWHQGEPCCCKAWV